MSEAPSDYITDKRRAPYSNTKEQWHLSKGFNVGTLLTVIVVSVSGLTYINGIAGDVERIEQVQKIQNEDVKEAINDLKEINQQQYNGIQRQNERLQDKMDKIIDKVQADNGR